jgi:outer membrane receptor protein involved in Fe transport
MVSSALRLPGAVSGEERVMQPQDERRVKPHRRTHPLMRSRDRRPLDAAVRTARLRLHAALACAAALALAAALFGAAVPRARAQETATQRPGRIEGRVTDRDRDQPLASANITVLGTHLGAMSGLDGRFLIEAVPAGERIVEARFMGYRTVRDTIQVEPGGTVTLALGLEGTVVRRLDPIDIYADRLIDTRRTTSSRTLSSRDLESMLTQAPTLDNIVEQQPGVVRERGKLHFRGGRADESLFVIDGIKVRDLLSGESSGNEVAARAAQDVEVMTGGFDARYSQAMSGVVETRIKEGSPTWHGALAYDTDLLLDDQNVHQFSAELSGPNVAVAPLLRLLGDDDPEITFYSSLSSELSNGYMPTVKDMPGDHELRSSVRDQIFGQSFGYGDFFAPLADNQWRALVKTVWKADANNKLSLYGTKTISISQDWGTPDIGEIDRNVSSYPWAWAQRLDHHYTITRDTNIASLTWSRALGMRTHTNVRLWRHYTGQRKDVGGKRWDAYDTTLDSERLDDTTFVDTPYFIDTGDATDWSDRYVVVYGLANDWNLRLGTHEAECGITSEYHDVQYMSLNARTVDVNNDLPLGDEYDLFHVTPNAGNLYAQDRFEHEGMNVSLGLTYDYWFPGAQVERALAQRARPHFTQALFDKFMAETHPLFGHRFKGHLSPRVGVSFPVSEDAHLFFNYGHYTKWPTYYYVYAKSSSQSGEEYPRIGNPTLNPQISVSYEIGTEYQFVEGTALRGTLFWRDMYDYPTTIRLVMKERATSRSNFFMYWNMDYARSRGVELSLFQRRRSFLAGSLSYTYSIGKGKSSDPNKTKLIQETGGDSREPALEEEYLWWNRPHKLTAQVNLRIRDDETPPRWLGFRWPRDFQAKLYFMLRSGKAYTPLNAADQQVGDPYSRNGPSDRTCDLSLSKGLRLGGRRYEIALNVYNLFDWRTPLVFDPVTGLAYRPGAGTLTEPRENPAEYRAYVDETVRDRVRAYVADYRRRYGRDPDATLIESYGASVEQGILYDFTSAYYGMQNPSDYSQPRSIRVGVSYAW